MRCKVKPPPEETITCSTCVTPWHVACLTKPPETLASSLSWLCPDCSGVDGPALPSGGTAGDGGDLVAAIRAIEADEKLTDKEKARKRQELLSGKVEEEMKENENEKKSKGKERESDSDVLDLLDGSLNCSFCMQLPERPVTVRFTKQTICFNAFTKLILSAFVIVFYF